MKVFLKNLHLIFIGSHRQTSIQHGKSFISPRGLFCTIQMKCMYTLGSIRSQRLLPTTRACDRMHNIYAGLRDKPTIHKNLQLKLTIHLAAATAYKYFIVRGQQPFSTDVIK